MTPSTSLRLLLVVASLAHASPAAAQAVPPVSVGSRVRAWVPAVGRPEGWLVGTAVAVRTDAIEIRDERTGEAWSVPLARGSRVEVSRGRRSRHYGAAAGAVGGFILGEVAGFILLRPTGGKSADLGTRAFERLRSPEVLLVGAAGAVGGFFLGRRMPGERWEPVALVPDVGVVPGASGVSVRVAWRR